MLRLAEDLASGLTAHRDVFPAPPVDPDAFHEILAEYRAAREVRLAHVAQARQSTAVQQRALRRLRPLMQANLRYAEFAAREEESRLQLLGWGPVRRPSRKPAPGQPVRLTVHQEGADWVLLVWRPPTDGGPVAAYRVQRRDRLEGAWVDVGTAVDPLIRLDAQPTGTELEYQILAVNRAGEGPPSNVVRAVL
ncbi:MAG: fibronectin type III domain-containing protein [Gemmatimonadales bacterium]